MIIVNYKKILIIILSSSILGLAINFINPAGIPLIRERQELKWAPDSLFLEPEKDSVFKAVDSTKLSKIQKVEDEKLVNDDLKEINENDIKSATQEPQKTNQKEAKEEKEVTAFSEPQAIKLEQAFALYNKGVLFIDARDESDFLTGHITNSINIPFDDFDNHQQKLEQLSKEKPLVIYCAGTDCDLSILLGNLLFEKGYNHVYVFFGGWLEWLNADYPVKYPDDNKNE